MAQPFAPNSRYANTPERRLPDPDHPGEELRFLARRILPPVEAHVAFDHCRLTGQERLDQIAAEGYGDPHLWWRIMDASGTADPAELEAETGRLLALPLPLEVARNGGT